MKRNVLEMGTSLWEYLVEGGREDKWAVLVALLVGGSREAVSIYQALSCSLVLLKPVAERQP